MRGLWITSVISLVAGIGFLVGGWLEPDMVRWSAGHGAAMLVGTVLMGLEALHYTTLGRFFPDKLTPERAIILVSLYPTGVAAVVIGTLVQASAITTLVVLFGWAVLVAASIVSLSTILDILPGRKESVVDMDADPLTKGDDASLKHIRFAHFFLPAGLVAVVFPSFPFLAEVAWAQGLAIGGMHLLGIGYGLLSMYGIGHLWVPRFSGVPAIAAGAIKGEMHSTLPALILLPIGFALGMRSLIIAGGAFAFLGFFTYMGVLGANIMRNKSPTHRVTPEFVYIPWTFTGIFWLISGVLMGIFLNVVPDLLAGLEDGLRAIHIHIALFGGVVQLVLGWLTRITPADRRPPRFTGTLSGSFYMFNSSVLAVLFFAATGDMVAAWAAVGLFVLSMVWYIRAMQGFLTGSLAGEI